MRIDWRGLMFIAILLCMAVPISALLWQGLTDPIHLPGGPRLGPFP